MRKPKTSLKTSGRTGSLSLDLAFSIKTMLLPSFLPCTKLTSKPQNYLGKSKIKYLDRNLEKGKTAIWYRTISALQIDPSRLTRLLQTEGSQPGAEGPEQPGGGAAGSLPD